MGIIKLHCLLCAALILTGCAASNNPAQPTARKAAKAPPMPPTPPGLKIQKASTARIATTSVSATPDSQFISASRFGDVADDYGQAVAVDRSGNVIIGGVRTDESGGPHPFLAKRLPSGSLVWSNIFGGNGIGSVKAVATDASGNILVAGSFFGTLDFGGTSITSRNDNSFVAKFSSAGAVTWVKRFGTTNQTTVSDESFNSLAVDTNDNSVVVTGFYGSEMNFGGGPMVPGSGQNLFLVKLSSLDGSFKWSREVHSAANTFGNSVAIDSSGNIFLTGGINTFSGLTASIDFGNGPIPVLNSGMFLAKYTAAGGYVLVKQFGVSAEGRSLALDRSGNVVVTGSYQGAVNFGGQTLTNPPSTSPLYIPRSMFVSKLSTASGAHVWSKQLGAGFATGVAVGTNGNIAITTAFGAIHNLAPDGTARWSKSFVGSIQCSSVATDANGYSYVVGNLRGTVDFGGGPVTSAGRSDIFLVEFGEPSPPSTSTGTMQISEKFVDPVNGDIFIVSDLQQANMDIAFRMQTRPGGPRQTIGTWGASPIAQRVGVSLQAGLPVAWVDTVQTTPASGAARMAPASLTDTGWRTKGYKVYRTGIRTFVLKP